MQETALFYLRRYRNDLESKATFDHEYAAKRGMSYGDRQRKIEEAEKNKQEYDAICWVYDQIASGK